MTARLPLPEKDVNRKRRAHKKSRRGCGNCKLRRIKCDESKPRCKRCIAFGVSCNYDPNSSDLQLSVNGAFSIEIPQRCPCSLNQTILSMINASLSPQSMGSPGINIVYQLGMQELELLSKFQTRTVLTIGTDECSHIFQNVVIKLACSHPFLMYVVLTLTLMHDRSLSPSPNTKQSTAEAFYWYQGTALFNSKLSMPIQPSERDALWVTAAFLDTIVFSCIEAKTPEEAWPLKPPSSLDLDWLRMSGGKEEIWKITDPLRANGVFQLLASEHQKNFLPTYSMVPELEALPSELIKLYGLDATSTTDNNPYYAAASVLASLINIECNHSTILKFLSFISYMHSDYKQLLERKEPRALLLLAYWYAKVSQYQQWWIWRRAVLECQATCIYLERYHGHDAKIQNLLQFPRIMCGLVAR